MAQTIAYGFEGLQSQWSERVTEVGVQRIWTAVQESLDEYNRQIDGLLGSFIERTTDRTRKIMLADDGELQPVDEWGNPLPMRPKGSYDVAFPIQGGATAWGANRVTRALMTVEEANRYTIEAMKQDARWIRRHALAAILDNQPWTFNDPQGDIVIQPIANGDSVTYNLIGGNAGTDNHYLAGTAALSSSTFVMIRDELLEHPSNTGPVVVYVPSNLVSDIEAIGDFVEVGDPDIQPGAMADTLVGRIGRGFGDEVLGKVAKCWIVEWRALPDNYMIAHSIDNPVLAMREYPAAELQGFFMERHSPDGNIQETRMLRYAGFGVANRIAAVVYQHGTAQYGVPSGFDAPLGV